MSKIFKSFNISAIGAFDEVQKSDMVFSIFDHWLDEKESDDLIVLHDEKIFAKDLEKKNIYYNYENLFLKFYSSIYNKYKVFIVLKTLDFTTFICEFDSSKDYTEIIKKGIREEVFFSLLIPELLAIISSGHDFTHHVTINKINKNILYKNTITEIIKESGLFVLKGA
ncbi:MAG: hypothetical protein P8P83_00055 [Rickettsiaceae bacterium]|nr:hypothetical protein [Rickettsiaceae bacterium]